MNSNSEISFYVDTLIVNTILSDEGLVKQANENSMVSSLVNKVKDYFSAHIDPNDREGSLLNLIAPGAISVVFSSLGLGWLGLLFGLAMRVFNVDVKGILNTIYNGIKSALGGDKEMTSSQIDGIVQAAVQSHTPETTPDNLAAFQTASLHQQLKDARLLKLSLISYQDIILTKNADLFSSFTGRRTRTISLLGKVLGWVFKVAIASAGLMVAGDVVNKFLNRPNAFDKTIQHGKSIEIPESAISVPTTTQTKFSINSNYKDIQHTSGNWIENYPNTQSGVENMLLSFVKEVYAGLDNLDNVIKSTPEFKATTDEILWYNHNSAGDPIIFLPKIFTSKKQIVDHFIDSVAKSSA